MDSMLLVVIPLILAGFALGFLAINSSQRRRGRRIARGGSIKTRPRTTRPIGRREPSQQPAPVVSHPPPGFGGVSPSAPPQKTPGAPVTDFETKDVGGLDVSLGSPTGSPICPYCQQIISPADDIVVCPEPRCGTKHHKACWHAYGGCSMFNCSQAPVKSL